MATEFSFTLIVNGSSTLPSWIYVDELNRKINIIGANILTLESYLINFSVNSLLLIANATYSSSVTITFTNQPPQVTNTIGNGSAIAGELMQYQVDFTDTESDQIFFNLTQPSSSLSLNYTFNSTSFVMNWTPLANETGTFDFSIQYYDIYHQTSQSSYTFQIKVDLSYPPDFTESLSNIQVEACKQFVYNFPVAEINKFVSFTPQFSINVTQDGTTALPSWISYSSFLLTFEAQLDKVGLTNQPLSALLSESTSGLSTVYTLTYSVVDNLVMTFSTIPSLSVNFLESMTKDLSSY